VQLKHQWKRPRDWKVAAGAGAVAALGLTGLVLADPAGGSIPDAITLEERSRITATSITIPPPPNRIVDLTGGGADLDSPLVRDTPDDADLSADSQAPGSGAGTGGDGTDDAPAGNAGGDDDTQSAGGAGQPAPSADDSADRSTGTDVGQQRPPATDDSADDSPSTPAGRSPAPGDGDGSADGSQDS
jgi:hypothetical protein